MPVITKVTVEVKKGTKIELTMDEAKQLYNDLHEVFGAKMIPSHPTFPTGPYRTPQPWDTSPWSDRNGTKPLVTFTTSDDTGG